MSSAHDTTGTTGNDVTSHRIYVDRSSLQSPEEHGLLELRFPRCATAGSYSIFLMVSFGCGYFMPRPSSASTIVRATTQFRNHFLSDGTTVHGAQRVEVFSSASS